MNEPLNLLADAHVGGPLYSRLEQDRRFNVERVVDVLDPDENDDEIWRYAVENDRIILTNDVHFVNGAANPTEDTHAGIIRFIGQDWRRIHQALIQVHHHCTHEQIVEEGLKIRVPGTWA